MEGEGDTLGHDEAAILQYYNIHELYPVTWREDEAPDGAAGPEEAPQQRVSGQYGAGGGGVELEGLAPSRRDDQDPLQLYKSVGAVLNEKRRLAAKGMPSGGGNAQKYYISSKNFSPADFLRDVHAGDSIEDLQRGQKALLASITEQASDLKELVRENFINFVHAKQIIDDTYQVMKTEMLNPTQDWGAGNAQDALSSAYHAADVNFRGALDKRSEAQVIRRTLAMIDYHPGIFGLPATLSKLRATGDLKGFIHEYRACSSEIEELRTIISRNRNSLGDPQANLQLNLLSRVQEETERVVAGVRDDIVSRLVHGSNRLDENIVLLRFHFTLGVERDLVPDIVQGQHERIQIVLKNGFKYLQAEVKKRVAHVSRNIAPPSMADRLRSFTQLSLHVTDMRAVESDDLVDAWNAIQQAFKHAVGLAVTEITAYWRYCSKLYDATFIRSLQADSDASAAEPRDPRYLEKYCRSLISTLLRLIESFIIPGNNVDADDAEGALASPQVLDTPINGGMGDMMWHNSEFPFIPPFCGSQSTVHYLRVMMSDLTKSLHELQDMTGSQQIHKAIQFLCTMAGKQFTKAIVASMTFDAAALSQLETWYSAVEDAHEHTRLPLHVFSLFDLQLSGIIYMCKAPYENGLVASYKPQSDIAQITVDALVDSVEITADGLMDLVADSEVSDAEAGRRRLVLLLDLQEIRGGVLPKLVGSLERSFDSSFSTRLRELQTRMMDLDRFLLDGYLQGKMTAIDDILHEGFAHFPFDLEQTPHELTPYVYEALMLFVTAHAEVAPTARSLLLRVLQALTESLTQALISGISSLSTLSSGGMLQATVDGEFLEQNLIAYTTPLAQDRFQAYFNEIETRTSRGATSLDIDAAMDTVRRLLRDTKRVTANQFACLRRA